MALLVCFECGGNVSSLAEKCPNCGAPVESVEIETEEERYSKKQLCQENTIFLSGFLALCTSAWFGRPVLQAIMGPGNELTAMAIAGWLTMLLKGVFVCLVFRASRFLSQPLWQTIVYSLMAALGVLDLFAFVLIARAFHKAKNLHKYRASVGKIIVPALEKACLQRDSAEVAKLVEQRADPNMLAGDLFGSRTILERAVYRGDSKIVQLLLDHGAEVRPKLISLGKKRGHSDIASLLESKLAESTP